MYCTCMYVSAKSEFDFKWQNDSLLSCIQELVPSTSVRQTALAGRDYIVRNNAVLDKNQPYLTTNHRSVAVEWIHQSCSFKNMHAHITYKVQNLHVNLRVN